MGSITQNKILSRQDELSQVLCDSPSTEFGDDVAEMLLEDEDFEYSEEKAKQFTSTYTEKVYEESMENEIDDEDDFEYSAAKAQEIANEYTRELQSNISETEATDAHSGTQANEYFERNILNESAYQYALTIMQKESLCFVDEPECSNGISRYNGMYWEMLSDDKLKGLIYESITETDKKQNDNIDRFCKNVAMYIKYEARKTYVSHNRFQPKKFEKIQNRVVFKNCVYDARTGKVHEFDESLPYYFAVDAEYIEADKETPYYDKIKYDATDGDEESMEMFDLMIAYLMIPNRSAKCFFVMANARDSGKSLLGSFLADMYVGNRTKSIDPEHLAGRFSFANVTECVLLSCLEMNTDRLKKTAVSQFKLITGEKRIRSEAKYKNEQTIPIRFKLLLATNGGIVLPEGMADAAFYRRVIVIPFIKSTPLDRLISNLDKKLQSEKDAILSKCIRKLETHIGKDGGIVFPESKLSMQMKEKWMGGVCLDDEFIQSAFEYTGDTKSRVALEDVEMIYRAFIERKGQDKGAIIITDRKNLVAKIKNVHVGADKDKMRTKVIKRNNQKVSTNAICRIKWNQDFLEELGFY